MTLEVPYPELREILEAIGEAGSRLSQINASEGSAGNISVYIGWEMDPRRTFPIASEMDLPYEIPELAGKHLLVTGSGRRLYDIIDDPYANLGCLQVQPGGKKGTLYRSPRCLFQRLTSELNSHLAVHRDQVKMNGTNFQTIIHAQPPHLTYLSHIPSYRDEKYLNQHVLRWQPELIVHFPEGIGILPFILPGSPALMVPTYESLRKHSIVVWGKHGVMARSDESVKRACDCIEYAETGARYEYLNLVNHEMGEGLTVEEIRSICSMYNIHQTIF